MWLQSPCQKFKAPPKRLKYVSKPKRDSVLTCIMLHLTNTTSSQRAIDNGVSFSQPIIRKIIPDDSRASLSRLLSTKNLWVVVAVLVGVIALYYYCTKPVEPESPVEKTDAAKENLWDLSLSEDDSGTLTFFLNVISDGQETLKVLYKYRSS
jgi:hypothetical protein